MKRNPVIQIFILFLFSFNVCVANMASPLQNGTFSGSAFSSKDIDIKGEKIWVKVAKDYESAHFIIEYRIYTPVSGKQIPLLFLAKDFKDNFEVWMDGKPVTVSDIPDTYQQINQSPFYNFQKAFQVRGDSMAGESTAISWNKDETYLYNLQDLKFFETDLSKGEHVILVKYNANVWKDRSDWLLKRSFRYSLSPAQYWKSFGTLHIEVEHPEPYDHFTTNLGNPEGNTIGPVNKWTFDRLPDSYFELTYQGKLSNFAAFLIKVQPIGITLIIAGFLLLLHLSLLYRFRKGNNKTKRGFILSGGNFLIPVAIIFIYIFSYGWIDAAIGKEASERHGYVFLSLIYLPLLLPGYAILTWLIDKYLIDRKPAHSS